jgi:2-C-methyl-D-erythritol 2,4-cyclodiphosphate synthase
LRHVRGLLEEKGWEIGNIDAMVCLEEPKIDPHIPDMKANIAQAAGISEDDISIKATTNEQLGFIGRQEGVVAYAVCLIEKIV